MKPTRRRLSSPRERSNREASTRLWVASLGLVGIVLFSGWLVRLAITENPRLGPDLCREGEQPGGESLIFLDSTDPWNPIQREVLRQQFRLIQDSLPRFHRVHLYSLDPGQPDLRPPLLSLCNPGRVGDLRDIPIVGPAAYSNPEAVRERWERGFVGELDSTFQVEVDRPQATQSPLMETLRGAAIEVFGTTPASGQTRTVHIFSDLLQNSDRFSVYGGKELTPAAGRDLADLSVLGTTALDGAKVHLYLVDRGQVGLSALVEFWDAYLGTQNAIVMQVRRIEG